VAKLGLRRRDGTIRAAVAEYRVEKETA